MAECDMDERCHYNKQILGILFLKAMDFAIYENLLLVTLSSTNVLSCSAKPLALPLNSRFKSAQGGEADELNWSREELDSRGSTVEKGWRGRFPRSLVLKTTQKIVGNGKNSGTSWKKRV